MFVNQIPIAGAALRILLGFSWIIQRKLDVMKSAHVFIVEYGYAVTIRSDRQLYLL